jgi:hypothetical protein
VWVWDASKCPLGSTLWVGAAVNTAVRWCMVFTQTWALDPSVHNRYNPGSTTCTNGGSSYKSIIVAMLTTMKNHHTAVQASMLSIKSSVDIILSPTTSSGIGSINRIITDELNPIVT